MADLLGTDEFLVNRNDVTYTQQQDTLMASLETTDYLLINRAGQTYKITGGDLIDSVIDPLELAVILNPTEGYKGVEVTAIPVVSGGKQPDGGYIFNYQWVTATDAAGTNKTPIAGETGATFTPDDAQLGLFLGCVVNTTDALGTFAEGEAYIGPISILAEAPIIDNVVISEIYDGANRFTDKEFPYVTTMAVDGEPNPTYEVKAKLSGTTFDFDVLSDVITDVEGGGIATCETDLIESVDSVSTDTHYDQQMTASASTNVIADPNTITGWIDTTLNNTNLTGDASVIFARFNNPTIAVFSKITAGCGSSATHYMVYWDDNTSEWVVDTKYVGGLCQGSLNDSIVGKSSATTWALFRPNPDPNLADGERFNATRSFNFQIVTDFTTPNWGFVYDSQFAPTTLTFPSSNGFDCFAVGDVVQRGDSGSSWVSGTFIPGYEGDKAFDGLTVSAANTTAVPSDSVPQTCKWDGFISIPTGATVTASVWAQSGSSGGFLKVNNVDVTPNATGNNSNLVVVDITAAAGSAITSLEINRTIEMVGGIGFAGIFIDGAVVTGSEYTSGVTETKIISIPEPQTDPPTITVDGGDWTGSDGSGTPGEQTTLTKQVPYDTKLTVAGPKDLADMTGSTVMTDGTGAPGPYSQTPYKLVTTDIEDAFTNSYTVEPGGNARANIGDMLDGDISTAGECDLGITNIAFDNPISGASKIEYYLNWNNNQSGTDPAQNHKLGYNSNVNNDATFHQKGSPTGWYTIYEGVAIDFTGVYVEVVNNGLNSQGVRAIKVNGTIINFNSDITLTFPGDVSTNPDLRYFKSGDVVQQPDVKVISTGYPDSNTMVVDGGEWAGADGPTQTRPLMYQTTGVPDDDSNLFLRSNRSKATGGVYDDTLVDTWTADGPGVLSLFFQNNAANGAAPAISTFNFSSSDGVTCSAGSTWDLASSGALTITFTFPSTGSFEIEYFVADASPFNNHIIYYYDFAGGKQSTWTADGQAAVILDGGTNVQVVKADPNAQSHVEYQTNGGEGDIVSVNTDDNTILLTNTGDRDNRWIIGEVNTAGDAGNTGETGDAANAKNHYVAPANAVPITQDHAWCNLQIVNDKAQVTGIQKEETTFTPVTAKDYSIKFPSVFGTGNAPDTDLPDGTAISVEVKTENEHGSSEKESNTLAASVTRATETSQLDSNDPADVAKQQAIAAAFNAFPVNVNNRRTSIASSLYRLYAGENVSANEFELLEEVVSNAVNVVEPFALDGYYPLYYTAAKANAASSEGTHHTHTINGITYYMPDGGTIYHGNYI